MNRNSIRRATTCCLTAAVVLSGSSFVANAAVNAGVGSLISAAQNEVQIENETSSTAGVSGAIAKSLGKDSESSAQVAQNEKAVVKSEYDDIAIAQVDNYVNVRSAAGEDGEVLGKLYNNSACTVLGTEGDWYKIHSGDVEGYIKAEFLVLGDAKLAKSVGRRVADVKTESLNVRSDASTDAELLGQVPEGEELSVVEEKDGWVLIISEQSPKKLRKHVSRKKKKRDGQPRRQQDGQQLHAAPQVLLVPLVLLAAAQRQAEAMLLQVVEMARQLLIMLASLLVIHMYMAAQA